MLSRRCKNKTFQKHENKTFQKYLGVLVISAVLLHVVVLLVRCCVVDLNLLQRYKLNKSANQGSVKIKPFKSTLEWCYNTHDCTLNAQHLGRAAQGMNEVAKSRAQRVDNRAAGWSIYRCGGRKLLRPWRIYKCS